MSSIDTWGASEILHPIRLVKIMALAVILAIMIAVMAIRNAPPYVEPDIYPFTEAPTMKISDLSAEDLNVIKTALLDEKTISAQ